MYSVASFGAIFVLVTGSFFCLFSKVFNSKRRKARTDYTHDVIIIGCSITGPFAAKALSEQGRRVLVIERDLWRRPDRIIGELLQPGGIEALSKLNMEDCAHSIGTPCTGYVTQDQHKRWVQLPYKNGFTGCSFHFGDFVQNLRRHVYENCNGNVEMVQGTVNNLLSENAFGEDRVYGVQYSRDADYKTPENPFKFGVPNMKKDVTSGKVKVTATAPLVLMCDGGASKFKGPYSHYVPASKVYSYFIGLVLKDAKMPYENKGTVVLGRHGPLLAYRLDENEVRLLVDYPGPNLPDLKRQQDFLINEVAPQMPKCMREALVTAASDLTGIRSMPLAKYKATFPSARGILGLGDSNNQRHALTGGGITCCFNDVLNFAHQLKRVGDMRNSDPAKQSETEQMILEATLRYSRTRYIHSSCINILAWALYDVFTGPVSLRSACFDYFKLGGEATSGPMDLLSGINPSPLTLLYHYVCVMLYGVYTILTLTGSYATKKNADGSFCHPAKSQRILNTLLFFVSPCRIWRALYLFVYATCIFLPLAWMEFISIWFYLDPTSPLATKVIRPIELLFLKTFRKSGKPVAAI